MANAIERPAAPATAAAHVEWVGRQRALLRNTLRVHDVKVVNAWPLWNSKRHEVESLSYVFEFDNGLTATGLWVKAIAAPDSAPATIILHDKGIKAASEEISDRVNRGEQVLALDLVFTGDSAPADPGPWAFTQFLAAVGDRPLGIEAAHAAVTGGLTKLPAVECARGKHWNAQPGDRARDRRGLPSFFEPFMAGLLVGLFGHARQLMPPDLFCLDLYKNFDLDAANDEGRALRHDARGYARPAASSPLHVDAGNGCASWKARQRSRCGYWARW
jgi:hypothetical protein